MRPVVLTYLAASFTRWRVRYSSRSSPRRLAGAGSPRSDRRGGRCRPGRRPRARRDASPRETSKSLKRTRLAGRGSPALSVLVDDDQAGEMDVRERAEVEHRAVRDSVAHRGEQGLEIVDGARATGATIVSARWYGIAGAAGGSLGELEREVEDLVALPEDEPEVEAGGDLADLVSNPAARRARCPSSRGRSSPCRRTSSAPCRPSRESPSGRAGRSCSAARPSPDRRPCPARQRGGRPSPPCPETVSFSVPMSTCPFASPSGISPAGLRPKSSSSSAPDMLIRSFSASATDAPSDVKTARRTYHGAFPLGKVDLPKPGCLYRARQAVNSLHAVVSER